MPKKDILIHACCATCSAYVIEKLSREYHPVLYYFNPNIHPTEEYRRRRDELQKYAASLNIPFYEEVYAPDIWFKSVEGLENEPEKGKRCEKCFALRLQKTAAFSRALGCNLFTTTLTISPHKNSNMILQIGKTAAQENNLFFLDEDFKKQDGFKKTMEMAKALNFYRQNYCGCLYSKR